MLRFRLFILRRLRIGELCRALYFWRCSSCAKSRKEGWARRAVPLPVFGWMIVAVFLRLLHVAERLRDVVIRFLGCLPLGLRGLLHCFSLLLGGLLQFFILRLGGLLIEFPRITRIFRDAGTLCSSRYRPSNIQTDQQCEDSDSLHAQLPSCPQSGTSLHPSRPFAILWSNLVSYFTCDSGIIRLPIAAVAGSSTNTRNVVRPALGCTS